MKHKVQLLRLLSEILKNNMLANELMFKGGTYAALRGVLNRFSVDLDFDLPNKDAKSKIENRLYDIFKDLGLEIKNQSKNYLQFFLKYPVTLPTERNTLKLEINDVPSQFNKYEKVNLLELNMFCNGHTVETMFANKLVAAKARFDKKGKVSGRDFYDLHKFFEQGFGVNTVVVKDLTKMSYKNYLGDLVKFVEKEVSEQTINEDLNTILDKKELNIISKHLKTELIFMLNDELAKLG
ncbi:MAG: nucleotidyl transferase AbiEii/AbiGii toxin family protein [Patescibacteria group bacterium]